MNLRIKRLHPDAIIPTRNHPTDAGLDIYALEDEVVLPFNMAAIATGIALEIPEGFYGKFASRSGLAFKNGITSFHGTVDASYRGEIKALLFNHTGAPYFVNKGDRIAQLIILPCALLTPIEVENLSEAGRGTSGFGSSGY